MFFFLVFVAIIVGVFYTIHQSTQSNEAWTQAARRLRLLHDPGGLFKHRRLAGRVDAYSVVVETFTRGSGKNSSTYTRYRVLFPRSLNLGLQLSRQGFFSGVAKAFGVQDITLRDPKFDDMVMVKGRSEAEVIDFLTANRREWIRRMMVEMDDLKVDDAGILTESRGVEKSATILVRKVERMIEFAGQLADPMPQNTGFPGERGAGEMVRWVQEPPALPVSSPPPRTVPPLVIPPLPAVEMPTVEESPGKELVNEEQVSEQQEIRASVTEVASESRPFLSASEVGAELFSGNRGISEIERRFAADFVNQKISGEGLLRNVRETHFDFTFGSGPYLKATVEMPMRNSIGGRSTFQVLLRLPSGTECPRTGEKVSFSGRMLKVDALMRLLYVSGD